MARAGPRKVSRYGDHFKATAVKLSGLPGVLIQDVAAAQWLGQQQSEIAGVIAVARLFRPFQKDGRGGLFRRNGFHRAREKLSQM